MKICTDSLIFGSMAPLNGGENVLDIGTGTGILALMAAQLGARPVDAIEITHEAFVEAKMNFQNSPWAKHMNVSHKGLQAYTEIVPKCFDLIICNPPFFQNGGQIKNDLRRIARCSDHLALSDLLKFSQKMLSPFGKLYVLMPPDLCQKDIDLATFNSLHLIEKIGIRSYADRAPHVYALTFSRKPAKIKDRLITIYRAPNVYSCESEIFLKPFLLRFADDKLSKK